jgi:hypothetical protein
MKRLRETALANGVTEFVAEVLPDDSATLRLLREAGSAKAYWVDGEIDVHVDLKGRQG